MVHVPKEYRRLFQDSISVTIPLHVTADLGVAIRHTRQKRIRALNEHFPSLKPRPPTEKQSRDDQSNTVGSTKLVGLSDNNSSDDEEEDDDKDAKDRGNNNTSSKSRPGVLLREQYGSVVDYLEAKYVRGVMLEDEEDEEGDADDNDRGSVYDSENSFVDDSLLKRDLAEQVMSQSTHTKLELENDDDDFFVNVGNLEVEDNDLMDYDPLVDDEQAQKAQNKRKRPKSTDAKASAPKKTKTTKSKVISPKKAINGAGDGTASSEKPVDTVDDKAEAPLDLSALQQAATERKQERDRLYRKIVERIKAMTHEDLPRKRKLVKRSIVVPEGKGPGDKITFANPHAPEQKLCVAVPKNKQAGDEFFVNVPIPTPSDASENKFTREFQILIVEYASVYDEWCDTEAKYHDADPNQKGKFKIKKTKSAKFDELVNEFPNKDMVAPMDVETLRVILRRARQNISKRRQTAEARKIDGPEGKPESDEIKPAAKKVKLDVKPLPVSKLKRASVKNHSKKSEPKSNSEQKENDKQKERDEPKVKAVSKAIPVLKSIAAAKPKAKLQGTGPSETIPIRVPGKGTVFSQFEMGKVDAFG